MSKVINIKTVHLKKMGYNNLVEWLKNPNHVYIGRHNHYVEGAVGSKWRNPFSVKKFGRQGCIDEFQKHLYSSGLINDIMELDGKTLGCWCKPEVCHGDVLVKALKQYKTNNNVAHYGKKPSISTTNNSHQYDYNPMIPTTKTTSFNLMDYVKAVKKEKKKNALPPKPPSPKIDINDMDQFPSLS